MDYWPFEASSTWRLPSLLTKSAQWTTFPILVMLQLKETLVVTSALTFSRFMSSTQEFAKSLQFFSTRAGFTKQFPTMHTITRTH